MLTQAEAMSTLEYLMETRTSFLIWLRDGRRVWADASSPTEWLLQEGTLTAWGTTVSVDLGEHSRCIVVALRDDGGRVSGASVMGPGEIDRIEEAEGEMMI